MLDTAANRRSFTLASAPGLAGAFVVGAAVPGWKRLQASDDGDSFSVLALHGTGWEIRRGCVYTHATGTATRGVLEESSSGAAVDLGPATVVTVILPATQANRVMVSGPQDFGGACDLVPLMNASIASGSNVFNSTDAAFTTADIGKTIAITGAGASVGTSVAPDAATLYGPLVTTITGINSPTQVTLAAVASRTVGSGVGIQYIEQNATVEASAKAWYGTDDTAALQAYVDYAHPRDGIVRIPSPGCMVLGTVYCQRSRDTGGSGLLWRRLEFRGVGPTAQGPLSGLASQSDSNLFKPTAGAILAVNLDASGAGMTSTGAVPTHQFYNFNIDGIAFHGMPGLLTVGMKLHRTRVNLKDATFNNLASGWNGLDQDVNGSENYCDQWTVGRVKFNNCANLFKQYNPDATQYLNIFAESFYPTVVHAIEITGGRGWEIKAPLINKLPDSAKIGYFLQAKEGKVSAGHFEDIWGNAFTVEGSSSWVDFDRCDFFNPGSGATAGLTEHTIEYIAAGGTVERCGFSFKRASGSDIYFGSGRHQVERNNSFFKADNITRRFPKVTIVASTGNIGTSFRQQYFVEVICWDGTHFDVRNVDGASVLTAIMNGPPVMSGSGYLNLDGMAEWGRPNLAVAIQKEGKYRPVLVGVYILQIAWYDAAGTLVTTPDTNMDCYLLVS